MEQKNEKALGGEERRKERRNECEVNELERVGEGDIERRTDITKPLRSGKGREKR